MFDNRHRFRIAKMAKVLQVSECGYYAWLRRKKEKRTPTHRERLKKLILQIFLNSGCVYGSRKIAGEIRNRYHIPVSRKYVRKVMNDLGIISKTVKKYKATTNSKHRYPVAENILNRDFSALRPGQKMVSDITYIPTDEGWLYVAAVMDLCGRRIIGLAMGSRMTQQLTIDALKDAVWHSGDITGCILHSDRGSQYCATKYQNYLKSYGFICSMSRKGNCWDNAPMESFWGKMKKESIFEKYFKTREEAKEAVFEYAWITYNRHRVHQSKGYVTPDEYYYQAA